MKILHTISSLGAKSGGTSTSTYDLVRGLNQVGALTDILTLDVIDKTKDRLVGDDSFIHALPNDGFSSFGYSKNISKALNVIGNYDIVHTNGMWMYVNYKSGRVAQSTGIPYMITLHGMLYPQALAVKFWKKKPIYQIFFKSILQGAACLHATCDEEMHHIRKMGIKSPIAVVPNLVPKPNFIDQIKRKDDRFRIGFLGRLHSIKNIHKLIDAWAQLNIKDGELCIIGSGVPQYESSLKAQVLRLGLNNVVFSGFFVGEAKFDKLASLSCLILPSESENFGMVVPEALMVGTPVIASKGTPWANLEAHHCGWWIDNDIESIAKAIQKVYEVPLEERLLMGENGKRLVQQEYSVEVVASKMKRIYEWLHIGGNRPEFVYL